MFALFALFAYAIHACGSQIPMALPAQSLKLDRKPHPSSSRSRTTPETAHWAASAMSSAARRSNSRYFRNRLPFGPSSTHRAADVGLGPFHRRMVEDIVQTLAEYRRSGTMPDDTVFGWRDSK